MNQFADKVMAAGGYGLLNWMPDTLYLRLIYRLKMKKRLNLRNPKSFNDKIQWLKIYNRNPLYTTMVDKFEAKKYVAGIIGKEYIIPTLGVWDRFDDIDFDSLPNQFVLKCTHDSGGLVICRDKTLLDRNAAKIKIEQAMKHNFYWMGREWPYKNVKPRIIAEKYMEDKSGETGELTDYKYMCFGGKVQCVFTCTERYTEGLRVTFFDREWNELPFERHYPKSEKPIPKPEKFEEMIELSEKLSKNIPFVRVDFYEVGGSVYFGEMTFYPGSGFEEFTPTSADYELGQWIELPEKIGGVSPEYR